MSFFASRWVPRPAHVRELEPSAALPAGFRAAGVACGLKADGGRDLGLLVCDVPEVTSAARFCVSGTAAAPVLLTRERCRLDGLRAVVVNSGNANAATGRRGLDEAARIQGAAALVSRCDPERVAVASTGVIGVPLPGDRVLTGVREAHAVLRPEGA